MGLRPSAFGVEYQDVGLTDATTTASASASGDEGVVDSFDGGIEARHLLPRLDGLLREAVPRHGRSHDVFQGLPKCRPGHCLECR